MAQKISAEEEMMMLGFLNLMSLRGESITRTSLQNFSRERFADWFSRNRFVRVLNQCLAKFYIVEGPKRKNAPSLLLSDTGRHLLNAGTVVEVVNIVSEQRDGTCIPHALAKLATRLLQEGGTLVDFNQVLGSFLAHMTRTQIKNGVPAQFFNKKK